MIKFNAEHGKSLTLLNLTDVQLGHSEWEEGHINRKIFIRTADAVIKRTNPDIITVSGDISYGGDLIAYKCFADYMDSFGIPWTVCFGNHDNQGGAEAIKEVVSEYLKHPLFLYEPCDEKLGNGNFVIGVYVDEKPLEALILMDTHDRVPYTLASGEETLVWARLIPEQFEWYRERIRELKENGFCDSTLITHIPIYAYRNAYGAATRSDIDAKGVDPQNSTGKEYWKNGYEDSFGVCYEEICSYPEDDGAFEVIKSLGNTKTIVAGHDHINNFVINHDGVKFVYATKTGAGCYWNPALNGGTVLTFAHDGLKTVRHEYEDVSDLL